MQAGGNSDPSSRRRQVRDAITTTIAVALLTTAYYLLPTPGRMHETSWAILFFGGVAVLAVLILVTVLRLIRAGPDVRVRSLVALLCVAVLFFSWAEVVLAKEPGQFDDLHTKTDSLYFAVSTLATVGFGDVHATGQLARAAVIIQILFNLLFLGLAITVLTGWLRHRAGHLRESASGTPGASSQDQT
jgi:voltage-gated potassium channel